MRVAPSLFTCHLICVLWLAISQSTGPQGSVGRGKLPTCWLLLWPSSVIVGLNPVACNSSSFLNEVVVLMNGQWILMECIVIPIGQYFHKIVFCSYAVSKMPERKFEYNVRSVYKQNSIVGQVFELENNRFKYQIIVFKIAWKNTYFGYMSCFYSHFITIWKGGEALKINQIKAVGALTLLSTQSGLQCIKKVQIANITYADLVGIEWSSKKSPARWLRVGYKSTKSVNLKQINRITEGVGQLIFLNTDA